MFSIKSSLHSIEHPNHLIEHYSFELSTLIKYMHSRIYIGLFILAIILTFFLCLKKMHLKI